MGLAIAVPHQVVNAATEPHSCPALAPLVKKAGLPKVFLYIAWRESRCVENAVGWNYKHGSSARNCRNEPWRKYLRDCGKHIASFDSGYWQVNSSWYTVTRNICGRAPQDGALLDGWCNARVARWLYDHGGLGHWRASSVK